MLAYFLPVCGRIALDLLCGLLQAVAAPLAGVVGAPLIIDHLPQWLREVPSLGDGFWMLAGAIASFILGAVLLVGAVRNSRRDARDAARPEPDGEEPSQPRLQRPSGLRGRPQGGGGSFATARSDEPMGDDDQPMPETKIESTLFAQPPTREVLGWIVFQDKKGTRIPISQRSLRIGRHPDNDIQLENRTVHRFHATMRMDADGVFTITDVGTLNKVFVNRKAHEEVELRTGDLVQLGEVRFKFYAGSDGPPRGTVEA